MPDCRPSVRIPSPQPDLRPIEVSLEWTGSKGPVLTGDYTKFVLVIGNGSPEKCIEGTIELSGRLTSPFTGQGATPSNTVPFEVGPGKTEKFPVPDHWMYVEGKFSWVMVGLTVNGYFISREDPLASFTVFERSTYDSQSRSSWSTLLISGTAAASSILAAALGFVLLAR